MKNYMVFGYKDYEEKGGMDDFLVSFDSMEESDDYINDQIENNVYIDYLNVYGLNERKIIKTVKRGK